MRIEDLPHRNLAGRSKDDKINELCFACGRCVRGCPWSDGTLPKGAKADVYIDKHGAERAWIYECEDYAPDSAFPKQTAKDMDNDGVKRVMSALTTLAMADGYNAKLTIELDDCSSDDMVEAESTWLQVGKLLPEWRMARIEKAVKSNIAKGKTKN